jgi:hypothetical protein
MNKNNYAHSLTTSRNFESAHARVAWVLKVSQTYLWDGISGTVVLHWMGMFELLFHFLNVILFSSKLIDFLHNIEF